MSQGPLPIVWARTLAGHLRLRLEIAGLEHIQPGTAYIVTPLHEGLADAVALLHLPLDLRFVARDEFLAWPFFVGMLFVPFPWAWGVLGVAVFLLFFNTGPANTVTANVSRSAIRGSIR